MCDVTSFIQNMCDVSGFIQNMCDVTSCIQNRVSAISIMSNIQPTVETMSSEDETKIAAMECLMGHCNAGRQTCVRIITAFKIAAVCCAGFVCGFYVVKCLTSKFLNWGHFTSKLNDRSSSCIMQTAYKTKPVV